MSNEHLLGKIAVDRNQEKLGKIKYIHNLPSKTIKVDIPHAVIIDRDFLDGEVSVPIAVKRILEVSGDTVAFDILKVDFEKEATKLRLSKKQQEYQESMSPYEHTTRARLSPYHKNVRNKRSRR